MTNTPSPTPPDNRACAHCTAWRPWGSIAQVAGETGREIGRLALGQCRAVPPAIDAAAIGEPNAVWPVVEATDWCRAFKHRDCPHAPAEPQPGGEYSNPGDRA